MCISCSAKRRPVREHDEVKYTQNSTIFTVRKWNTVLSFYVIGNQWQDIPVVK